MPKTAAKAQPPEALDPHRYACVEAAIRYLEANAADHPDLETLAAKIGFSPTHFQRMFSSWVGVSPKKYLGYLTLDHAKNLLAERRTVLETTLETGLSSPGRLHDLFVTWEAMSPGVYASGGEGLTIRYGWSDSPFGAALAMGTEAGLCGLAFANGCGREAAEADLRKRWPNAVYVEDPTFLAPWAEAAFTGKGAAKLALIGAPFQIKVWEALLRVPSGYVTTYSDIAAAVERPKAARAVGTAVGRNPVSWLIPCHRALRLSGELGGYHWGLPIKRAMLAY
ncbi:MAG: bifunctional helix-turn-helix domain-containing protein/methylated-DNA--[protein]-cysteine S-methyltransferase, partial [Rhodobacteraceae bacterium]|nr:bifunctional helix-turn-helix domain-containing protein/methylated-DNA--[protein]-cysteine S-methyltransferase [Paracoccaceae bacterium]